MRQTSLSTRFCIRLIAIGAVLDEKISGYLSISAVGLEAPLFSTIA